MKLKGIVLPALILMIAMGLSLVAGEKDELIERSFQVKENGMLIVDSDLGSIAVVGEAGERVQVTVSYRLNSWNDRRAAAFREDFQVEMKQEGNDVRVVAEFRDDRRHRYNGGLDMRFTITVPQRYNVDLSTAGGSISVDDLQGTVEVKTSGGSLNFGEIHGTVRGRTSGGSISLQSCSGPADIHTSGGSINVGAVDGDVTARTSGGSISIDRARGDVRAETSGGSINVEEVLGEIQARTSGGSVSARIAQQPRGECRLETSAGTVSIYLAEDIAVDLDARASSGKVFSDFDVTTRGSLSESTLRGTINGGGPRLYLRTSAGKIRIRKI